MQSIDQVFDFVLVSPERLLLSEKVSMVTVPGSEGDMGILYGHAPVISSLRPGLVNVYNKQGSISHKFFLTSGFVSVDFFGCKILSEKALFLDKNLSEVDLKKHISQIK